MNFRTFAASMALAFCALAAPITPALAATSGIAFDGGRTYDGDGHWTLGWSFNVTTTQQLLGLGVFDAGSDGLLTDHQVGLWDTSGTLLASVVVKSGDTLVDGFRFASITPFTLNAGSTYFVGAADLGFGDAYWLAGNVTTAPGITYLASRYAQGSGLNFPEGLGDNVGYLGGNILLGSAVPEPATWAMMIIGFGAVGSMVRTSRRRSAMLAA